MSCGYRIFLSSWFYVLGSRWDELMKYKSFRGSRFNVGQSEETTLFQVLGSRWDEPKEKIFFFSKFYVLGSM